MSENILAQFLRSEKDLRPYWETDHRGMVLPLIKSGYNNSVSYGLPGILGGSAPSVLNDILQGRMVDKGEIEQGATDAAGAAMTGSLAMSRPSGSIGSGGRPETTGIRAYHGSPHDFDKFDISKIGTGEGAQAYGHGLYFAENEGVAKSYKTKLSPATASEAAAQDLAESHGRSWADMGQYERQSYISEAEKLGVKGSKPLNGRMYEVNIKADPNDFLDWDKPLSQQSEKVRGAIERQGWRQPESKRIVDIATLDDKIQGAFKQEFETLRAYGPDDPRHLQAAKETERLSREMQRLEALAHDRGKDLVQDMHATTWHADTAKALREAGIPGIKYLDQGSRVNGEGSRNYVVFDDALVEILRKYGLAGLAVGAGAMAQQPSSDGPTNVLGGYYK